jgi:hypothetical protein
MFERAHHQRIVQLLARMDAGLLREARCYFAGGTAIALQLAEFRESVDIDFLCADQAGYRLLRSAVFERGLADLFPLGVELLREVRSDRDGVRAILATEGIPVKFEIVREARIELDGDEVPGIPVPCLARNDLFAEKLLANADRWNDKAAMSRDIVDLLIMAARWGGIPAAAWDKARSAYGDAVDRKAIEQLREQPAYRAECLAKMGIVADVSEELILALAV